MAEYLAAFFAAWSLGYVVGWKVRMIYRALWAT